MWVLKIYNKIIYIYIYIYIYMLICSTMYWTDWGSTTPKIEMAAKTGVERTVIVAKGSTTVKWPNGITLDLDNEKLYWVDAYTDRVSTYSDVLAD